MGVYKMMLTEQIINAVVLLIVLYGVHWMIVHAGNKSPGCDKKCSNCFWIYNKQHSVFCSDPDTPVRFLDKSLIKKFHCSRWSKL
jgi:hypothetical protein